jgi:hypothetical protein
MNKIIKVDAIVAAVKGILDNESKMVEEAAAFAVTSESSVVDVVAAAESIVDTIIAIKDEEAKHGFLCSADVGEAMAIATKQVANVITIPTKVAPSAPHEEGQTQFFGSVTAFDTVYPEAELLSMTWHNNGEIPEKAVHCQFTPVHHFVIDMGESHLLAHINYHLANNHDNVEFGLENAKGHWVTPKGIDEDDGYTEHCSVALFYEMLKFLYLLGNEKAAKIVTAFVWLSYQE